MAIKLSNYIHVEDILIHGFKIIAILFVSLLFYIIVRGIVNRAVNRAANQRRAQTIRGLLDNVVKYAIFIIALAMILREAGVDPVSLIAGAGIIGVALGFGAQSIVRDVLSGFFILFEGAYVVGDVVNLHIAGTPDIAGMVEEIGLRSTRVQELNGKTAFVPNGAIICADRYPLGYVPYFITLVFPSDIGRKSLKEWLDRMTVDMTRISKIIANEPRVVQPMELSEGKILARFKVDIIPGRESEVESIVNDIRQSYKETFYHDLPEPTVTELSDGALQKYKSFFAPHESLV